MLISASPTLASLDLAETVAFYEGLGFRTGFHDEGYAIMNRDEVSLHFWKTDNPLFPKNTSCYISVKEVDSLYVEMQRENVIHPNAPLRDQPWGMREFAILDIHGNLIRFGQPL